MSVICPSEDFRYYINFRCTFTQLEVWSTFWAIYHIIAIVFLVYMLKLNKRKMHVLVTPNPNVPWTETYSLFTLMILKCLWIYSVSGIIVNIFEFVYLCLGAKYGEWIVPQDYFHCQSRMPYKA